MNHQPQPGDHLTTAQLLEEALEVLKLNNMLIQGVLLNSRMMHALMYRLEKADKANAPKPPGDAYWDLERARPRPYNGLPTGLGGSNGKAE